MLRASDAYLWAHNPPIKWDVSSMITTISFATECMLEIKVHLDDEHWAAVETMEITLKRLNRLSQHPELDTPEMAHLLSRYVQEIYVTSFALFTDGMWAFGTSDFDDWSQTFLEYQAVVGCASRYLKTFFPSKLS